MGCRHVRCTTALDSSRRHAAALPLPLSTRAPCDSSRQLSTALDSARLYLQCCCCSDLQHRVRCVQGMGQPPSLLSPLTIEVCTTRQLSTALDSSRQLSAQCNPGHRPCTSASLSPCQPPQHRDALRVPARDIPPPFPLPSHLVEHLQGAQSIILGQHSAAFGSTACK